MAFSQTDLTALESAIAQGALEVKYQDRTITYRSLDDMIRTRNMMRVELGIDQPGSNRKFAATSKGMDRCGGLGPFGGIFGYFGDWF